jgi:hypothetical protein
MTEITVDREGMDALLARHLRAAEGIGDVLNRLPNSVDGGVASTLMGFIVRASAEASALVADSHRLVAAVTTEVLGELHTNEEQAELTMIQLTKTLEGS